MDIPIDKPLVLVTWLDAKDGQTGWHSIEDIEKEKLATQRKVSQDQLAIARENKNKYDAPNASKKDKK